MDGLDRRQLLASLGAAGILATDRALPAAAPQRGWPGAGALFAGACYQPVDRTPAQITRDIALMRQAGFNCTRMGDLSWDAFEPAEGQFTFDWFDAIMDQMHAAGIRVMVDIPGLPAPMWLHQRYPGVDIVNQFGARLAPVERYMDDISDPDYRRLAHRLGEKIITRYAKHPATIAFGYDNEIGNGYLSYSPGAQQRFVAWLQQRYGTLETLNRAWATQRWSRRLSDWAQVTLPYQDGPGPPERFLDLHRFWSDQIVAALADLDAIRQAAAPQIPAISNLYDTSERKGFDYLATYRRYASYGAMGFYPNSPLGGSFDALMMRAGTDRPVWFNEFEAGGPSYHGKRGQSRMLAHLGLLHGGQTILAWTFNSHLGGEEQVLFGLLDHDGTPSWKLQEFAQIAADFRMLEKLGFPRKLEPKVAIAYSFDSRIASHPNGPVNTTNDYFKIPYRDHVLGAYAPFFAANQDVAVIDVAHEDLSRYRLIVVAGAYVMDEPSAAALRRFVASGGTLVMTAYSAKVDEHAQWFGTPLPGRLHDVFGLTTNAYYSADAPLQIRFDSETVTAPRRDYEVLVPTRAHTIATFEGLPEPSPAITRNAYGRGQAFYVAVPAQLEVLRPLMRRLCDELGIPAGPATPEGVYARVIEGRTLYVNTRATPCDVALPRGGLSRLTGRRHDRTLRLEAWGADLVEFG